MGYGKRAMKKSFFSLTGTMRRCVQGQSQRVDANMNRVRMLVFSDRRLTDESVGTSCD